MEFGADPWGCWGTLGDVEGHPGPLTIQLLPKECQEDGEVYGPLPLLQHLLELLVAHIRLPWWGGEHSDEATWHWARGTAWPQEGRGATGDASWSAGTCPSEDKGSGSLPTHRVALAASAPGFTPSLSPRLAPSLPRAWHRICSHPWHCHCPVPGITVAVPNLALSPSHTRYRQLSHAWHCHCPQSGITIASPLGPVTAPPCWHCHRPGPRSHAAPADPAASRSPSDLPW